MVITLNPIFDERVKRRLQVDGLEGGKLNQPGARVETDPFVCVDCSDIPKLFVRKRESIWGLSEKKRKKEKKHFRTSRLFAGKMDTHTFQPARNGLAKHCCFFFAAPPPSRQKPVFRINKPRTIKKPNTTLPGVSMTPKKWGPGGSAPKILGSWTYFCFGSWRLQVESTNLKSQNSRGVSSFWPPAWWAEPRSPPEGWPLSFKGGFSSGKSSPKNETAKGHWGPSWVNHGGSMPPLIWWMKPRVAFLYLEFPSDTFIKNRSMTNHDLGQ